jgi:hypothetical protein
MWLASLRRLVVSNFHSRKERRRLAARKRKLIRLRVESLEERLTPSGSQTAGSYSDLVNAIAADTGSNTNYVIQITNNFTFNPGGQVSISTLGAGSTLTVEGQNSTNYTLTGNGNRLFDIAKGQTVTLENLTLTGGNVTTTNAPALGGAVYNSGNLTMKSDAVGGNQATGGSGQSAAGGGVYNKGNLTMTSVVVGGNQAVGGNGQNAAGGGIYSSGGSLTLSHDVIGRAFQRLQSGKENLTSRTATSKHSTKTVGASNKAASGSGGSAQGGGLYIAGGTVKVSNCTIAGNQVSASVVAQGGGLYVAGVAQLNLNNDVIGREAAHKATLYPVGVTSFSHATAYTFTAKTLGNPNKAFGGSAMGGGLYVSGGTVSMSQGGIADNQATGNTATVAGGNGGSAQGGGIYVNNAKLTLTGGQVSGTLIAGNGGNGKAGTWAGGAGGNAQGGAIFATNSSTVTASGTTIAGSARPGNGGNGATGTSLHVTGGMGGASGVGQGGAVYIKGGSLTLTNSTEVDGGVWHSENTNGQLFGAQGGKGGAGYNGNSGAGGAGGQGSNGEGGGVLASNTSVIMEAGATIQDSEVRAGVGGQGGKGKTGGQGGNGGMALGGGLFIQGGSVSLTGTNTGISNCSLNDNTSYPNPPPPDDGGTGGTGGSGTIAGIGGKGGDAYGGGLYALSSGVTLNNGAEIADNFVFGGLGGRGGNGYTGGHNAATGGAAGAAVGGGVYLSGAGASLQINAGLSNSTPVEFFANGVVGGEAGLGGIGGRGGTGGTTGGNGGNGGSGGLAEGGAIAVQGSGNTTINLNNAEILDNDAKGGEGGFGGEGGDGAYGTWAGGNGGFGGAGGSALGGSVYVQEGALTLTSTTIEGSLSEGGLGGLGAGGGFTFGTGKGTKTVAGGGGIAGNGNAGNVGGVAQGGGLYANASTVTMNTATIDDNGSAGGDGGSGGDGGVTYIHRINGGVDRKSSSGANGGNGGAGQGGGVFATGNTTLTALDTDISGNAASGGAGGAGGPGGYYAPTYVFTGGNGGIGGNGGNAGVGQGGGAYVNGGAFTLVNSTVADNALNVNAANGGAGGKGGNGSTGQDYGGSGGAGGNGGNAAPISGGGVFATASALKLVNATVANNTLTDGNGGNGGNGGNAGAAQAKPFTASRQGVGGNAGNGGNAASGQGGGLYLGSGSLSLLNATFAYNTINAATPGPGTAGKPGTGIFNNTTTPPTRLSADGQPGKPGTTPGTDQAGGLYVGASVTTASLENTILALNTAATDTDVSGTFSSSDDDFIGDGTGFSATTSNGDQVGTSSSPINPQLSPLQNNGGPTQTIVPFATSPTIGAGDPSAAAAIASAEGVSTASPTTDTTDQRGLPRFVNGKIDIGATELQVDFTGSPSVTTVQAGVSGQTITYTVNLTNGEGEPINVTLTDLIPGGTTYNSNSAGGSVSSTGSWTITQPSATNSNTLTATATLNPGDTATLSFTVTVASTATGTINDIATLGWTGTTTNTTGSTSVAMNTTVSGGVSTTSTVLSTSGTPSVYGQPVTFTATVSGSGTPTGEVVFEDGNTILGKETLSGGVATFTTSTLSVGSHSITAVYCGDPSDSGSKSNTVTQVVNKDSTTTTLATSISPSVYGQSVTFTATVSISSPGAGTPTGTVTFYDGSTKLGTGTLSGSVATLATSALPVGSDSITAKYGGDTNDLCSTSVAVTQVVDKDSTSTTLASTTPSVYGQSVTFTATVGVNSPGAGTPTGTVTFYDGNTELGTGTLNSSGMATFTTSTATPLSVGSHSITAVYGGDSNDLGSGTQSAVSQTVNKDSTTTTLAASQPSVYGQPVTFAATVSPVSPGAGTPTGIVTFYDGSTELGTGTLSGGVATFTTSTLPGGSDSITASYNGDTNDLGSTTSSALSQVVNPASTSTGLTSSLTTSPLGQNVTFTAAVSVVSPGSGTPAGSVEFVDTTTGIVLGTVPLLSSGTASLSVSSLVTGSNAIEAIYSGQTGDFLGSTSSSLTETISQSILVLNGTVNGSLKLSGNASINVPGNVIVDSSSTSALTESGNAAIKAASIQVVGGVSTSGTVTLSPAAVTGITPVANPLAYLTGPSTSGLTNYGAVSYTNGSYTLNSGIYTSIRASGTASLTLNPGIYLIEGGGITVTGGASIAGSGVMIYNTSSTYPSSTGHYGGITLSGSGSFSLTAPTSGEYAGIVIFQPSANTRAISLSGNAAAGLTGTIYAPAALAYFSGNASVNGALVVNELTLSGNAASTQAAAGSNADTAEGTAGQLLAGDVEVYVNNSNGELTSDELARIQDAVNALNTVVSSYGVAVAEVSDPTLANVTLSMGTNSAAGNYGQGVLGCYTTTGTITLIQGWNWYAGADPTQIAANQYDFETTVTHELGHALGLGHSSDPTSAMYPTLAPATVIRTLTTADLSIPDAEAGADPQMAAPLAVNPVAGVVGNNGGSGQGTTPPLSTNIPSSGNPLSVADQLFTDLALVLGDLRNVYQPQLSFMSALWQQADALAVQRLDALLSLEADAMGVFQDALARSPFRR